MQTKKDLPDYFNKHIDISNCGEDYTIFFDYDGLGDRHGQKWWKHHFKVEKNHPLAIKLKNCVKEQLEIQKDFLEIALKEKGYKLRDSFKLTNKGTTTLPNDALTIIPNCNINLPFTFNLNFDLYQYDSKESKINIFKPKGQYKCANVIFVFPNDIKLESCCYGELYLNDNEVNLDSYYLRKQIDLDNEFERGVF